MLKTWWVAGVVLMTLGLFVAGGPAGCSSAGGGGGGGGGGDANDNGGVPDTSAGAAAFAANGCSNCHTAESNNFSDSSIDDIVDTLLGEQPHPGGDFGELTDEEIDDITDFLVEVMLGDEDLDGGDNTNDNVGNDNGSDAQAHDWFEKVWTDFDENYSHFETKDVDWDAIREDYEPQFQTELSTDAFLSQMATMLAELRDLHVWLFDAGGQPVDVYSHPAAQNYPNGYPDRYFPSGVQQMQDYPLRHGWLENNIAYLSIESFDGAQWDGLRTGEVDDLFALYADADALVIDVRSNNGGNELVGATLAGHLTDTAYVYGYHRTKNAGPDHNDFGELTEHRVDPAENQRFLRPAVCLIGERNLSSAEWFVLMMLENPGGITLIGDTTRGSSGNPQEFALGNGITYYIPSWEAYRADQVTPIEDTGIPPSPGQAIAAEESYTEDRDFVLERAIDVLAP
ncbi:MAG: S41 family peptidase [Planctomycetota bacterium]